MKNQILEVLERNGRQTVEQIAVMTGRSMEEIGACMDEMEKEGIIIGYNAIINWKKTDKELVQALIEVKVKPQKKDGFDKVAERIYRHPEVKDCYLMSGGFDLTVVVEGMTMNEVNNFVAEKLAPIEFVEGTATHFVMKRYKDKGFIFESNKSDEREKIVL